MIAELVSSALGLALYLNTLSADFCYDDRWQRFTSKTLLTVHQCIEMPPRNFCEIQFWKRGHWRAGEMA
ncbi:transmembrane and TPR repeat-containing protein 2 precursor [Cricetulus griseus]|uniref:Transmembrane and TPR repeat-containing protein 2 n=1 Tax=Cricetulus griseus TaxID=10029 RepID=A0A061ILW6_CRIGR|nr:transmembrane and TPR repeat-containing protein 2 precursor [Cricetulus griseus]